MQIIYHPDIEKDLKSLKRFPTPKESLEAWERLFCLKGLAETPGTDHYPGFGGRNIYKARVIPLKENCGKSGGYRLIFQSLENNIYKILVFSRHGNYNTEKELMDLIRLRF